MKTYKIVSVIIILFIILIYLWHLEDVYMTKCEVVHRELLTSVLESMTGSAILTLITSSNMLSGV